jgi:subtilisin-like proprotein convertase family protein
VPTNTMRLYAGLISIIAASLGATGVHAAEDGPSQRTYYYNGRRRVNVDLALDEVWIRGARRNEGAVTSVEGALDEAALEAKAAAMQPAGTGEGAVCAVLYRCSRTSRDATNRCILTDQLAVKLAEGADVGPVMGKYGLELERVVPGMANTYILRSRGGALMRSLEVANALYESGAAVWANPMIRRLHTKRYTPGDPRFGDQWHLKNDGTQVSGAVAGNDVNVTTAWDTVRGTGINIAVVDDGMDLKHPDLAPNARTDIDYDYWQNDNNPSAAPPYDMHGTSVAGIAAARGGNDVGVSGAAPMASLVAVRLIVGATSDAEERDALLHNATPAIAADATDICSNSWGPVDDGVTDEGPLPLAEQAFIDGTTNGRGGLGIVYTWAAGNGEQSFDDSNYDGYANQRYTIAVAASDAAGVYSPYSEPGANILVNAPSSKETWNTFTYGTTTTDLTGLNGYDPTDYTSEFGGTSSATPLVSGVVALVLERNPLLGWRDVQEILLLTATKNDSSDPGWQSNGAGHDFHHHYGFGRVNAAAAVAAAATWVSLPAESASPSYTYNETSGDIPDATDSSTPGILTVTVDVAAPAEFVVEHVDFTVDVTHTFRGDLSYTLMSPDGTTSEVIARQDPVDDLSNWRFMTVANWGEGANGTWTLEIKDNYALDEGALNSWSLDVHGRVEIDLPPAISDIANQTILQDAAPSAPIPFTISDPDTSLGSLSLTAASGTPSVVANAGIVFGGNGAKRTLTIAPVAGQVGTATITVTVDDGNNTAFDTFIVSAEAGVPTVQFASASSSDSEAMQFPVIPVQLSSWPGSDVTVECFVRSGTAGGADYTLSAGTITFTGGSTEENLPLEIVEDVLEELNETVTIALRDSAGAAVGGIWEHTYTINDDDTVPTINLAQSMSSVNEGDGVLAVSVILTPASGLDVTVDYTVTGGTAEGLGVDFGLPDGTLSFASGVTERTILISIVDDGLDEADETIELSLESPTNAAFGATSDHEVTIVDNDMAMTPFSSPERSNGCAPAGGGDGALQALAAILLAWALRALSSRRMRTFC